MAFEQASGQKILRACVCVCVLGCLAVWLVVPVILWEGGERDKMKDEDKHECTVVVIVDGLVVACIEMSLRGLTTSSSDQQRREK